MALAAEEGPAALTLDRVAREAGVSKGGLLHHFPSKHDMLVAVLDEITAGIDREVESLVKEDPVERGQYVRAYLHMMDRHPNDPVSRLWGVFSSLMLFDPSLKKLYVDWINRHPSGDADCGDDVLMLSIVRLASDGLWMADLLGNNTAFGSDRRKLIRKLNEMTLADAAPRARKKAP